MCEYVVKRFEELLDLLQDDSLASKYTGKVVYMQDVYRFFYVDGDSPSSRSW